jgi:hypothetical protein
MQAANPLDPAAIPAWRLRAQQLAAPRMYTVGQVVAHLGGVQAQEYAWAKWSIGLRLRDASDVTVERAIAAGEVVRTWAYRGTLHLITSADAGWLIPLLAPAILAANGRRYRQLDLDGETFARSNHVIEGFLAGGRRATRADIARELEAAGISAQGQRAPYLLQRAALDGLICHGPPQGREPTYVLLAGWVPPTPGVDRDQALATLAQRYFRSHGPATLQDFTWWSGLPAGEARQGLEGARPSLAHVTAGGKDLWAGPDPEAAGARSVPNLAPDMAGVVLLPPFDEYLFGYRDRSAVVGPATARQIRVGGGMPRPAIVVDGRVVGTWGRTTRDEALHVTVELRHPLGEREQDALQEAVRRFGEFWGLPARMVP